MCIGGHYTMDRFDAVVAAEFVKADRVIPCHYDTFPPIETDAQAFKSDVQGAGYSEVVVLDPGETLQGMTTAVVLIEAERDAMSTLGGALADLDGVAEAYSVTGEWDFVAIVRVPRHDQLAEVVTGGLLKLPGVRAHADDGRLRGVLPARPRVDVLDRELVARSMTAREPIVRPEFGPSLWSLAGRRAPVLFGALAVLAVALVGWRLLGGGQTTTPSVVVHTPVAYNLAYAPGVQRVAPRAHETLRLASPPGTAAPYSFAVSTLRLPAYRGDVSAELTFLSATMIDEMRARIPGFAYRGDGRVNVNQQPGYQIVYQARIGGKTVYGKRVLLVPGFDPPPRAGLDVTLEAARSATVPSANAVGLNGALKTSLRSLRFGTQRP